MADNNMKITDAGTITSMNGTDKVFVNSGDDLKQITLDNAVANSTPVKTLSSNLGMILIAAGFLNDKETASLQLTKDRGYLFINTHAVEFQLTYFNTYNNCSTDIVSGNTTITYDKESDKYIFKNTTNCRGTLFMLKQNIFNIV